MLHGEHVDYANWVKYSDVEKIDALYQEVKTLGTLVRWGVAAAGAVGALIGSLLTVIVEHFWK